MPRLYLLNLWLRQETRPRRIDSILVGRGRGPWARSAPLVARA